MMRLCLALCLLFSFLQATSLFDAQSEGMGYRVERIASGLQGIPWGMAFVDEHTLFITQIQGDMLLLDTRTALVQPVFGMPFEPLYGGQGGLLDVAISPHFQEDSTLFFTYVKSINFQGATTLARATLEGHILTQWKDLLITHSTSGTSRHFGSRIAFDEKGYVYFSVGDRGMRDEAQELRSHTGTIVRLRQDGTIPEDNPFIDHPFALKEIYSYGHRNPQGLAFDPTTHRLYASEHGPRGGDEINLVEAGKNYGWPTISYGKEYWAPISIGEGTHKEGLEQPLHHYTPSIAPGSLLVYTGDAFPAWRDNLFLGALKLQHLNRIVLNKNGKVIKEERLLESLGLRIRQVIQNHEGHLYLSTDTGEILRIVPQ
ncbi:PQQ-dependent sugar dehydrogenase [Sulfurospirillum sp. T05]|uniref:PQQ-dependent sugar dehydrogenase n=1 Tax=Sulfurospirillum tamanense TaxID=2813362 RepID=A0ABS2WRJ9_9BACT|nr:PQQ-dependent sugar dehydrogenase [Sulfurospirillum tamanensis]MBN2964302.1 PQQ-dependent sugar dehydrogenase [Sulfurospirillum tamanensis]